MNVLIYRSCYEIAISLVGIGAFACLYFDHSILFFAMSALLTHPIFLYFVPESLAIGEWFGKLVGVYFHEDKLDDEEIFYGASILIYSPCMYIFAIVFRILEAPFGVCAVFACLATAIPLLHLLYVCFRKTFSLIGAMVSRILHSCLLMLRKLSINMRSEKMRIPRVIEVIFSFLLVAVFATLFYGGIWWLSDGEKQEISHQDTEEDIPCQSLETLLEYHSTHQQEWEKDQEQAAIELTMGVDESKKEWAKSLIKSIRECLVLASYDPSEFTMENNLTEESSPFRVVSLGSRELFIIDILSLNDLISWLKCYERTVGQRLDIGTLPLVLKVKKDEKKDKTFPDYSQKFLYISNNDCNLSPTLDEMRFIRKSSTTSHEEMLRYLRLRVKSAISLDARKEIMKIRDPQLRDKCLKFIERGHKLNN